MKTTIIDRPTAIDWLSRPKRRKTSFGERFTGHRHPRGPGAAVDLINYGLLDNGTLKGVLRIGNAPFGGNPVKAAIGKENAAHAAYLMRLYVQDVTSADLQTFVENCLARFRSDMRRNSHEFRYLFSLDDPEEYLIEGAKVWGDKGHAGKIYARCGALSAGFSNTRNAVTQFIDPDGNLRSIYRNGRNLYHHELPPGSRLVKANAKHRFVFVLADTPLQYRAWRGALPSHVVEMTEFVTQPRLLKGWRETAPFNTAAPPLAAQTGH